MKPYYLQGMQLTQSSLEQLINLPAISERDLSHAIQNVNNFSHYKKNQIDKNYVPWENWVYTTMIWFMRPFV